MDAIQAIDKAVKRVRDGRGNPVQSNHAAIPLTPLTLRRLPTTEDDLKLPPDHLYAHLSASNSDAREMEDAMDLDEEATSALSPEKEAAILPKLTFKSSSLEQAMSAAGSPLCYNPDAIEHFLRKHQFEEQERLLAHATLALSGRHLQDSLGGSSSSLIHPKQEQDEADAMSISSVDDFMRLRNSSSLHMVAERIVKQERDTPSPPVFLPVEVVSQRTKKKRTN